jgi:hypothetical protein
VADAPEVFGDEAYGGAREARSDMWRAGSLLGYFFGVVIGPIGILLAYKLGYNWECNGNIGIYSVF